METDVEGDMAGEAYSNFIESIKSPVTKRNYLVCIRQFLEKIPEIESKIKFSKLKKLF